MLRVENLRLPPLPCSACRQHSRLKWFSLASKLDPMAIRSTSQCSIRSSSRHSTTHRSWRISITSLRSTVLASITHVTTVLRPNGLTQRLRGYGVQNVHLETGDPSVTAGRSKKFYGSLIDPAYAPLIGFPLAWNSRHQRPGNR